MTIEEAKLWERLEKEHKLPDPTDFKFVDQEYKGAYDELQDFIICLVNNKKQDYYKIMDDIYKEIGIRLRTINQVREFLTQAILHSPIVLSFVGGGTMKNPYTIETKFGLGNFCRGEHAFLHNKRPKELENLSSHSACLSLASGFASEGVPCVVETGLISAGSTRLHSVCVIKSNKIKMVLDFNLNLFMDYSLYCRLFCFEVLSKVNGLDVAKCEQALNDYNKQASEQDFLNDLICALAFEDVATKVKSLVVE